VNKLSLEFNMRSAKQMDFQLTKEQKQIVASLDEVGRDVFAKKAARWDENHEYPWENIEISKRMGVLGMTIPEAYGGQESPLIDAVWPSKPPRNTAASPPVLIVETNMGALGCVMAYGTDAQRKLVARRILEEGTSRPSA
jgi:alkylation response protein AidB-like acyl-CoA dehydrogenase